MSSDISEKIVRLHDGDPRCEVLVDAIIDLIAERASDWPIPTILGVLRITEMQIIESARD